MFAALNMLFCFLAPTLVSMAACAISVSALRRHVTGKQLLFSACVLAASVINVSTLYELVMTGQGSVLLSLALVGFTFMFSVGQFATAALFGGLSRLRQKMS